MATHRTSRTTVTHPHHRPTTDMTTTSIKAAMPKSLNPTTLHRRLHKTITHLTTTSHLLLRHRSDHTRLATQSQDRQPTNHKSQQRSRSAPTLVNDPTRPNRRIRVSKRIRLLTQARQESSSLECRGRAWTDHIERSKSRRLGGDAFLVRPEEVHTGDVLPYLNLTCCIALALGCKASLLGTWNFQSNVSGSVQWLSCRTYYLVCGPFLCALQSD
jgi:hypothetical protein